MNTASLYSGISGQRQSLTCAACSLPLHYLLAHHSASHRGPGQDTLPEAYLLPCRRFGRVRLQLDPANHPPVSKLGFDPLLGMPTLEEFRGLMAKQRRMLKVVIMDQVRCTPESCACHAVITAMLTRADTHPSLCEMIHTGSPRPVVWAAWELSPQAAAILQ